MSTPSVTVVLPVRNEARQLPLLLADLLNIGVRQPGPSVEFLVVDDGSEAFQTEQQRLAVDHAIARAAALQADIRFRSIHLEQNQGKGAAVRHGWAMADVQCDWLGFVDGDGAFAASEVWRVLRLLRDDAPYDALTGARVRMSGRRVQRSVFRYLQGRVFSNITQLTFGLEMYDTQCGLKFFRASVLRPLLAHLREQRWLLDLEILSWMKALDARVFEEPVDLSPSEGSNLRLGRDAVKMLVGLVALKQRLSRTQARLLASREVSLPLPVSSAPASSSWADMAVK